jgi:hypothetical protein
MEITGSVGAAALVFMSINWLFAKESHLLEFILLGFIFLMIIYWQAIYLGYILPV